MARTQSPKVARPQKAKHALCRESVWTVHAYQYTVERKTHTERDMKPKVHDLLRMRLMIFFEV